MPDAGQVAGELSGGHGPALHGKGRHVLLDRSVEVQQTSLYEEAQRRGGDGLGDAPYAELGRFRDARTQFQIGIAKALGPDDLAVHADGHGHARHSGAVEDLPHDELAALDGRRVAVECRHPGQCGGALCGERGADQEQEGGENARVQCAWSAVRLHGLLPGRGLAAGHSGRDAGRAKSRAPRFVLFRVRSQGGAREATAGSAQTVRWRACLTPATSMRTPQP
jgi:hypothetical protein